MRTLSYSPLSFHMTVSEQVTIDEDRIVVKSSCDIYNVRKARDRIIANTLLDPEAAEAA
jgi:autotransporter translocation and assembly factor TamB